jgi:NhaA family Na+:H+ antiporter
MGIITWVCVFVSGIHDTVAGVAVAMLVPAQGKYDMVGFIRLIQRISGSIRVNRDIDGYWFSIFIKPEHLNSVHAIKTACNNVETPLQRLEHALLPLVTYFILPLFAFLNAGLTFQDAPLTDALFHPVTLGCLLGLLIGKPIGITAASYLAVRYGVAKLPINVNWNHIIGASMLGGIGFTMSLFISGLSFVEVDYLNYSKLGIFAGSIMAAVAGLIYLGVTSARNLRDYEEH